MRGVQPLWADILLGLFLGVVGFSVSLGLGLRLPPVVFAEVDMYYGADINRVYDYMTGQDRFAHFRSTVHPIFSFLAFPPTRTLMGIGFPTTAAASTIVALTALVTCSAVFAFGRIAGLIRLDACLLVAVFICSGTFIHWWSVPETFAFGGMSVMLAFLAAVAPGLTRTAWTALVSLTLAFTTTNWAAGMLAAATRLARRDLATVVVASFVIVAILAVWQKAYVPTALFFFSPSSVLGELRFVAVLDEGAHDVAFVDRVVSFLANPWVASDFVLTDDHGIRAVHLAYGPLGWIALAGIAVVTACAVWNLLRTPGLRPVVVAPALFLAFQFVLHLVYGDEPFLYAAHFVPAMTCVLVLGFLGGAAWVSRMAAVVFCVGASVTNVSAFVAAMAVLRTVVPS